MYRPYLSARDQANDARRECITVLPGHSDPSALGHRRRSLRVRIKEEIRIRSRGQAARIPTRVGPDGEEVGNPRIAVPGRVDQGGHEFETLRLIERRDRVWTRGGSGDCDVSDN